LEEVLLVHGDINASTIPSHSRSHFPDDQEPARPNALTALSFGPKVRTYECRTCSRHHDVPGNNRHNACHASRQA